MKNTKKSNIFMYALVVLAIVMFSATITMAVLTDEKKGKEDIVFGKVAISGENSCLEVVIDEPITQDSEILNDERFLYFSPTSDTEPMIVRLKVEYQIDEDGYEDQIDILNSTIANDNYFVPYYDDSYIDCGYTYIYDEGYFYLVVADATSVELDNMFEVWGEYSENQFIICDYYVFHLDDNQSQKSVYTNLVNKRIKLVVTIEAAQREGLSSLADVWDMPEGEVINIGYDDGNTVEQFTTARTDSNGNLVLPTSLPAVFSGQAISFYYDNGEAYAPGSTVNMSDINAYDLDYPIMVSFAGLYGEVESVSGNPASIAEESDYTWQQVLDMGIFTLNNGVLSAGTGEYSVRNGSLDLPYNITVIESSAFNQYYDNSILLQINDLNLPGNLVTMGDIDDEFLGNIHHVTMFNNVQNLGYFFCNHIDMNSLYHDKGIYYIGSGNNPYIVATDVDYYNENYDPTDENSNGYDFADGFIINARTKFVSIVTLMEYTNINADMKTDPTDPTEPNLNVVYPQNYEIHDLKQLSVLYQSIQNSDSLFLQGPYLWAPFLTHENGVVYLGKGNNPHYAVVYAYASMEIPEQISFEGIEQDDIVTINSNTQIIVPGAFSCVYKYTITNTPVTFSIDLSGTSITRIDDRAFMMATITGITFPSNVTYIGNEAFYGCMALTDITIPASVSHIGYYAFAYTGITSFVVANGNTHFSTLSDGQYLVKNGVLVSYAVGNLATSVTLPSSITSIAVGSFVGCSSLTEVIIPSTVTSVTYTNADNTPYITRSMNNNEPISSFIFELTTANSKVIINSETFYDLYVSVMDIDEGSPVYNLANPGIVSYFYIYIDNTFDDLDTSKSIFTSGDGGYKQSMSTGTHNCYRFISPGE